MPKCKCGTQPGMAYLLLKHQRVVTSFSPFCYLRTGYFSGLSHYQTHCEISQMD